MNLQYRSWKSIGSGDSRGLQTRWRAPGVLGRFDSCLFRSRPVSRLSARHEVGHHSLGAASGGRMREEAIRPICGKPADKARCRPASLAAQPMIPTPLCDAGANWASRAGSQWFTVRRPRSIADSAHRYGAPLKCRWDHRRRHDVLLDAANAGDVLGRDAQGLPLLFGAVV